MLEFIRDDHFDLFRQLMDRQKRGMYIGIRLITSIDSHAVDAVEDFIAIGVEVKHIPRLDSKQFVISDLAVLEISKRQSTGLQVERDTTPINSYQDIFESIWRSATDASKQITELKSDSTS